MDLSEPILVAGFEKAPQAVRKALANALAKKGCGYLGSLPLIGDAENCGAKWLQLVDGKGTPDPAADALIYTCGDDFKNTPLTRLRPDQLLGITVTARTLAEAIPFALERQLDLLLLDCSAGISIPWAELQSPPDLTVLRDAIALLRKLGKEEEIALLNFGGMRSGTDVAKALAINCHASVFNIGAGLAMGGVIENDQFLFPDLPPVSTLTDALENWIKATSQETTMIACCTGKTSVHNLEPEDMRCITIATANTTGLPLASGQVKREGF
jgi:hypothetical protein